MAADHGSPRIVIRLPGEGINAIRRKAAALGQNVADYVRDCISLRNQFDGEPAPDENSEPEATTVPAAAENAPAAKSEPPSFSSRFTPNEPPAARSLGQIPGSKVRKVGWE